MKKNDVDFINLLCEHDINFLYESWTSENSEIDFNGYYSFNFYRKFQNRRARRNSGGTVVYIKSEYKQGVEVVKNVLDTFIWLRLDKTFFKLSEDMFICGAYVWGADSPAYNVHTVDLFELLQDDINVYSNYGTVSVVGDLNCRNGVKADYIVLDEQIMDIDDNDYVPDTPLPRVSEDKSSNNQGTKLLDLCKATGLRIANGRIGEDSKSGSYTYTNAGNSTIDYLLIRQCRFSVIKNFKVKEFNMFSDHALLYIEIFCSNQNVGNNEYHDYEFHKWDNSKKDIFRRELIVQLPLLNDFIKPENLNERHISDTVNKFVNVINTVAEPLFCVKGRNSRKRINCNRSSMEWFERDCNEAKQTYLSALRTFNFEKTTENRENLRYKKKLNKKLLRKKKIIYERNKYRQIEQLKHKKTQDFWRLFSKNRRKASDEIPIQDFFEHFQAIATEINDVRDVESEVFCAQNDNGDCVYEDLDRLISTEEVKTAIKSLKNSKSPGEDNILNEYFIEAGDILISHITDIFNGIFNTGVFPESWSKGIIVPVYKKGDPTLADNYHAITLSSCMSKLFTSILNNRIYSWAEEQDKLSDTQFGFRKERSTVDAIFVLQNLIQHVLNEKRRLYCAFVDLHKAFDSVYRNGLWLKL